jgi:predicted DCC family thiol-disulfide oxidoreductase YuxK
VNPQATDPSNGPTTLFVDGNCIVCDLEMAQYKRAAPELFNLIDISDPAFDATRFGLTARAVNKHIHVMTPRGEIHKGIPAFAHIWSRIPQYQKFSRVILWPGVNQLARVGYELFVLVRPWLPKKK